MNKSATYPVEVGDKKLALDEAYPLTAETELGFCGRIFKFTPNPLRASATATATVTATATATATAAGAETHAAAPAPAPASRAPPTLVMVVSRNNPLTLRSHPPEQQRARTESAHRL